MLNRAQRANGRAVIRAVCERGHHKGWGRKRTHQIARMAIMTTKAEAGMKNPACANVPESKKYHIAPGNNISWTWDGFGHDHASMGMYQQQTGYAWTPANGGRAVYPATMEQSTMSTPDGWGKPAELMDVPTETRLWARALASEWWGGHPGDTYIPVIHSLGERCQMVQGSAYPSRYQDQYRSAGRFLSYNLRFRRIWLATR
jgi:hypothetical protein